MSPRGRPSRPPPSASTPRSSPSRWGTTAARRPPHATRGTPCCERVPSMRCSSATPSTIRPRPCCSGSAAAPARARSPAWWPWTASSVGRSSACAAPTPNASARRATCPGGPTRTTPTAASGATGCDTRCSRCWRTCSTVASPRPSPVRPTSCVPTACSSTRSLPRWPTRATSRRSSRWHRRCALACCAELALEAGADGSDLASVHLAELDRLVTDWRGQERVELPGRVSASRVGDALRFDPTPVGG